MGKVTELRRPQTDAVDYFSNPWERSFPPGSVSGISWVLDVLDDLAAFAQYRQEKEIEAEIVKARENVALILSGALVRSGVGP